LIAKPLDGQSLSGVTIIYNQNDLGNLPEGVKFVYQSFSPRKTSGLLCFDSKTRTLTRPDFLFEKINIWVISGEIVGVMAAYSQKPLVSDSGFNLPLLWEEK
jgi:hypothetical protein